MTHRSLSVLALLVASALLPVPASLLGPAPAFAQDKGGGKGGKKGGGKDGGGKDGGKEEEKDPKDTPEWKACERIGADFAARNADALVARVHEKEKIRISLGDGKVDDYAPDHAKTVLKEWFKDRSDFKVEVKGVQGLGGRLQISFARAGSNRRETRTLLLTLVRRPKGGAFGISKIELIA